ncbi:hypothetical protein CcaverHIS002_0507800 [Cutaneotrichosporon cavernicola]|uniref:Elongin-C n=1 Tax=Cutaneotrichosporon cavernicola TaxID=279322 RepID=A0AA48QXC0_9TREE|nr:uncharacterized protein CcaverHIS019_0508380 [Cutaneotrichosporon cavernicola]BEI85379.1 hypothetical protein CcaverHIS002_0507800 [Cutaneotrichosporon cavernicola]BEI93210.1 hypothetical protein CcaverHIS019_0508380 [Cutaneotrichosporon cavernicola]BEJ00987.1 hypothetical protein CcaverHIS631_0508440 [Cutaneotrichosporon cavernicola]BEJ08753.1 hypothetical protein CcaverHIS641_0508470 [Cutaneotrichosporon cavernicola]
MADFVTLESADGFSVVVPRKMAMASPTLKAMLDEDAAFQEAASRTARLQYRGIIILKVAEYLAYKVQYADYAASDIREDFLHRIEPYIALELHSAADYLDI